ncbi:thioesterase family protein [Iamia sp. SCSIO 61187]|uniref:thioesterase family protein n=1 Tax=Iamia sp. SCSIO 61187 TaxID=2722752 RepID=UPI001C63146A|nr:thioesterase family protein [Iamia sp. SCSIO 61187]QYG94744.1 thioesterase family protein [Iamia sp. SCSIO 61187]
MSDDAGPDALFTVLDEGRVRATELARGPWDPRALHGGPVAALAARGLERALASHAGPDDPAFRPVRLTVELERPVGLDPLTVAAEVTRPGRSVRTAELTLHDEAGRRLARATLVAIRVRPEPLDLTGAVLPDDPTPPPPTGTAAPTWVTGGGPAFHSHAVRHSFVAGSFMDLGPSTDWIRLRVPVVAGEEPSPLQRVAAAADFGNGVSAAVAHDSHTFINPDLTVTLVRDAVGESIGIAATTRVDPAGVGSTETALWDERGRIGLAVQTLVVEPR